jgi:hypothetical protein
LGKERIYPSFVVREAKAEPSRSLQNEREIDDKETVARLKVLPSVVAHRYDL